MSYKLWLCGSVWKYDVAFKLYRSSLYVDKHGIYVPSAMGMLGVIIVLKVMMPQIHKSSTNIYMTVLALVDALYFLVYIIYQKNKAVRTLANTETMYCHMFGVLQLGTECVSNWLIVVITAERLYVVAYPLKVKRVITTKKAIVAVTAIFSYQIVHLLPLFFVKFVKYDKTFAGQYNHHMCVYYRDIYANLYVYYQYAVSRLLPLFTVFVLNIGIFNKLKSSDKAKASMTAAGKSATEVSEGQASSTSRQVTRMLIAVSI
ncbi:uncharacterized protein LOC141912978 [Tubulanus polymorphus]|uniref:uncharacterized protein LOC141912978 n=1 Tax=Tubulanus polymorphus TaxID=672921 RepID=UPI003DA2C21E